MHDMKCRDLYVLRDRVRSWLHGMHRQLVLDARLLDQRGRHMYWQSVSGRLQHVESRKVCGM
jgi:hypothetical protein